MDGCFGVHWVGFKRFKVHNFLMLYSYMYILDLIKSC